MSTKKTPFVDMSDALIRIVLMFVIILIGILCSISSNAAVKKERNPYAHNIKKNSNYSCKALMKKQRHVSNVIVKSNAHKTKWR